MHKAELTTRAVAGFIDLLLIIGMARLPDVMGFLAVTGYILARDGLFVQQSVGKKLIGLRVAFSDDPGTVISFRESIIRNMPLAVAYLLFLIPYVGWILGPLTLGVEALSAMGDERGMRIGDLLARTYTVQVQVDTVLPVPAAESVPEGPAANTGMNDTAP
jgi:uncharacterized RDD family membrane protein YckC